MANGIPLEKNRLKSQLTCACVYLDLDGATAGTSTGTYSESAPPEQPEPIVSGVSSAEAHPSGCVLTHAVLESQQQIVRAIGEISSHLKNITDALTDISHTLKELVKK